MADDGIDLFCEALNYFLRSVQIERSLAGAPKDAFGCVCPSARHLFFISYNLCLHPRVGIGVDPISVGAASVCLHQLLNRWMDFDQTKCTDLK